MKKLIMILALVFCMDANALVIDDFNYKLMASDTGENNGSGSSIKTLQGKTVTLTSNAVSNYMNSSYSLIDNRFFQISNSVYTGGHVGYSTHISYKMSLPLNLSNYDGLYFKTDPKFVSLEQNAFMTVYLDGITSQFHPYNDNININFDEFKDKVNLSNIVNLRLDFFGFKGFTSYYTEFGAIDLNTSPVPTPESLSLLLIGLSAFLIKKQLKV